MSSPDNMRERQRLAELYAGMSEGELQEIAADACSLTEEAQDALDDELERRGLDIHGEESAVPPTEVEQRELVTVRQFRDLPEALLAKGILDSAGIQCYLADDNMVRMDWFISNFLGGVKIKVRTEDFRAALLILNSPPSESQL